MSKATSFFKDAACAPGRINEDWEVFFSDSHTTLAHETAAAKQICRSCPVRAQCYEYALERQEWGIWGAATMRERNVERRRRMAVASKRRRQERAA